VIFADIRTEDRVKEGVVKNIACFIAAALMLCSAGRAFPKEINLTILHTNDTHGRLMPFSYGGAKIAGGISRRAELVKETRIETGHFVMLLDAGGIFQENAKSSVLKGKADIELMNLIGYDAAAPGQSEFGLGHKILAQREKEAQFPFVCANIVSEKGGKPLFEPMVIRTFQDVRIGIIGIAGADAAVGFSPDGRTKAKYMGPKKIIKDLLEKNKGKTDIVVVISNCGFEYDCGLAEAFAEAVPGIDVIIGGYSNTKLQKPVRAGRTVIAQAFKWGIYLGRLDLLISEDSSGKYKIKSYSGKLLPVTEAVPSVTEIDDLLRRYETEIEKAEKSEKTQKKS